MTQSRGLAVAVDRPGEALLLRAAKARRSRSPMRSILSRNHARSDDPMELDILECRAGEDRLHLRERWRILGANRQHRLSASEISRLRLRVSGREGSLLRLALTVSVRSDPRPILASLVVEALDRHDEAIDLALRIARCLGLSGYRLRHDRPADVELVPDAEAGGPYRSPGLYQPLPPVDTPADYHARSIVALPEVEWGEVDPGAAGLLAGGWTFREWRPGRRVELHRPGATRGRARLLTVLVRAPLGVLFALLIAGLYFAALSLVALMVLFLPAALIAMVRDTHPPIVVAYILGIFGVGAAVFSFAAGVIWACAAVRQWHDRSLSRERLLDWSKSEWTVKAGGHLVSRHPLGIFEGVSPASMAACAASSTSRTVPLVLERGGEDFELCRWLAPSAQEMETIRVMVAGLGAALSLAAGNEAGGCD